VALLLEARRRCALRGATLVVRGAPPKLRELAKLYGVDELVSLEAT
jgi:ABC-type transporter Mla MlaB component